ncbi:hypothetical protein ACIQZN_08500 [Streptomyces sp. NPDC097595]|uniref:hypothetical protein n=1 Tax=Streptomyces sp. NPDC097595 TaxID=3366090 RepID=UPI00380838DB
MFPPGITWCSHGSGTYLTEQVAIRRPYGPASGAPSKPSPTIPGVQIGALNLEIALTNFFNRINRTIKEPAGKTWG